MTGKAKARLSTLERVFVTWLVVTAAIHLVVEGEHTRGAGQRAHKAGGGRAQGLGSGGTHPRTLAHHPHPLKRRPRLTPPPLPS